MHRAGRGLLWGWVVLSLLLVSYAVSLLLASAAPGNAALAAMTHGPDGPFSPGDRFIIEPAGDPAALPTLAANASERAEFAEAGTVILYAPEDGGSGGLFPGQSGNVRLGRTLAWVTWNDSGAWDVPALNLTNVTRFTLDGVPYYNATTGARALLELNASLADAPVNASGFIVKGDAEAEAAPGIVTAEHVQGRVVQGFPGRYAYTALAVSVVGTALPVWLLIRTQRPSGAPGLGAIAPGERCPECGAPASAEWDFCLRCGAATKTKERPPRT